MYIKQHFLIYTWLIFFDKQLELSEREQNKFDKEGSSEMRN